MYDNIFGKERESSTETPIEGIFDDEINGLSRERLLRAK